MAGTVKHAYLPKVSLWTMLIGPSKQSGITDWIDRVHAIFVLAALNVVSAVTVVWHIETTWLIFRIFEFQHKAW
jgi:hypothetical protein